MTRLDPALVGILARRRAAPGVRIAAADEADADADPRPVPDTVQIMVKFTGDVDDLRAIGFAPLSLRRHPDEGWSIAAGPIPTDRLEDLDGVEHVVKVEASRPMRRELDRSVPEIRADQLHAAPSPFKGAGVVVGVVDTGIDWAHQCFRKADGTSRILGIWDQTLSPVGTEQAPAAFPGIGVEYTKAQIDAALAGTGTVNTVDDDGHGTHVAGIAAGDGSQAGNCSGAFTFVGVAPEADIIVVKVKSDTEALGESVNLVNALDFIWSHPAAAARPVVINVSLGDNLGAHDGTDLVEQMIDLELLLTDGHMVVKSAGNEGEARHHARVTLAAGAQADLRMNVGTGDRNDRHVEMWYDGGAAVRVTVVAPGSPTPPSSPSVDPGNTTNWTVDPSLPAARRTTVRIDSRTNDPDNNDNSIHIELDPAAQARIPAGEWRLRLRNTGTTETTLHAWIERGTGSPTFDEADAQRAGTISIPGTAERVVTVGAYSQSGFLFFNWSGDVAGFSSRGKTRDGRTKPDIAAPGVGIVSALTKARPNCCCDCCRDFYRELDGTSMAAPHVTGVVALMYQKNPRLDSLDVRRHLMETARVPDGLTAADLPNDDFGAGKVDAAAAVAAVPPPASARVVGSGGYDEPADRAAGVPDAAAGPAAGPTARTAVGPPRTRRRRPHGAAPLLTTLHAAVLATPGGQEWAADLSRHFSEVRGLINHNRRVTVAWQRVCGPALVAHLARAARGRPLVAVLPALAAGGLALELPVRAARMLDVLERHGSPDLAATIRRRRPEILALTELIGRDGPTPAAGDTRPAA